MTTWLRIIDKDTKHERSVPEESFDSETMTKAKGEATDPSGSPLPPVANADVAKLKPSMGLNTPTQPSVTPSGVGGEK